MTRGSRRVPHDRNDRNDQRDQNDRQNQPSGQPSAGDQLRDALARKRADDGAQEDQRARAAQDALRNNLSAWFNKVAADIPQKIDAITQALGGGRSVATEFSYSASDDGISLSTGTVDLAALPGFKKLDETCKDLNVGCTVTEGKYGYGRKSSAGKAFLHVEVNAEQPYRPVIAETRRPPGRR